MIILRFLDSILIAYHEGSRMKFPIEGVWFDLVHAKGKPFQTHQCHTYPVARDQETNIFSSQGRWSLQGDWIGVGRFINC